MSDSDRNAYRDAYVDRFLDCETPLPAHALGAIRHWGPCTVRRLLATIDRLRGVEAAARKLVRDSETGMCELGPLIEALAAIPESDGS